MQFFIFAFWLIFLFLNLKIVFSDIYSKKIFNTDIVYIIILGIIFIIFNLGQEVVPYLLILIFSSFLIYYLGIWSAGDAKYFLALSFFFPVDSYIHFISNIGLVSIIYIFIELLLNIAVKTCSKKFVFSPKESYLNLKDFINNRKYIHRDILKFLNILNTFLIIFLLFRVGKIYIFDTFLVLNKPEVLEKYNISLILWIGISLSIFYVGNKLWSYIHTRIEKNIRLEKEVIKTMFIFLLFLFLGASLIIEYSINKKDLRENLYTIFTLYLSIYIVSRICIWFYRSHFDYGERVKISMDSLEVGDKINRAYVEGVLIPQIGNNRKSEDYLKSMNNVIDKESLENLRNIYEDAGFEDAIEIYKSFSFSPHIFIAFCLTFIWGDKIVLFIYKYILYFFTS